MKYATEDVESASEREVKPPRRYSRVIDCAPSRPIVPVEQGNGRGRGVPDRAELSGWGSGS